MKSIVSRTNKFLNLVDKCENISPSGYVDKRFNLILMFIQSKMMYTD